MPPDCFFQKSRAAWISSALTWTHWPRTLTSGALSRANVSSSLSDNTSSPRATCQSNVTTSSSDNPLPPCIAGALTWARALSRCLVPLRVHHAGSSTPNPACSSSQAVSARN